MTFAFLDLKRPQYPSSPEVLLSALAWSVVPRAPEHQATGLIYDRRESSARLRVKIDQTKPKGDALEVFRRALLERGLVSADGTLPLYVAEAAADAMLGAQPIKGVGTSSSSIGLCGALLQDTVGALATRNPPNFAQLLNTMYALGGNIGPTAAELWFGVAKHYSGQPRLSAVDSALAETSLRRYLGNPTWPPTRPEPVASSKPTDVPDWWKSEVWARGIGTPFSWFGTSWRQLCSPEWYKTLPPRRWSGWAVCVLRNAIGFGFLWEANFYLELARGVVDSARDPATTARWALVPTKPLVSHQQGSTSQMDVMPAIKQLLSKGLACRKAILEAAAELETPPENLGQLIAALRVDASATAREAIRTALIGAGDRGGLPNLLETVRYSLLSRGSPEAPDHHSLLRVVSRNYTHVSPGPEWIVVISAMAAQGPRSPLRLGDVRNSLEALGFKPRIDFLLGQLERAGLCASASDGDEGIEINLGFAGR